ncbi:MULTISPECIES: hypothetical protein [Nocardia]|nr:MULTISPECIES: hypothetical protein [Nocardia]
MYIDPADLPDLGPMPADLLDSLVDHLVDLTRKRPELRAHLISAVENA